MNTIEKNHKWARLRDWLAKRRKIILIVTGSVLLLAAGIGAYFYLSNKAPVANNPTPETQLPKVVDPPKYYSPLTGSLVESLADTQQPVTGVMIENSPNARPQSGLKDSGVVFEAIAEGGITRFLVLYQSEKPQVIGPVRSLRLYDVDWLAAFDAGICHVGGSLYALNEIRNGNYRDLDQFFDSGYYWRSSDRYAPHNVYTSFANIDELNASKGYTSSSFTGFSRVDGQAQVTPDATTINITVSSDLFNSSYLYNPTTNNYSRSQAGEPHLDRESGQITPSVVIAMRVDETSVMQDGYREDITTIGSGLATIFQNGTAISATWNKTSKTSQITFTDAAGKDIPLVRGQTWITAVPNGDGDVAWS